MEIKILQVFYGKDGLPYKDKNRQVHFPITGTGFLGASNTTKIKFYYDELDNLDETTWVAVSKLPNGKLGSRVLESYLDEELNEHYALLELDNYYTQYKGDVFISLQGYQGGVNVDYDEENSQYEIHGTPTISATGSIKFTNNYAPQFVGSGETDNVNFQRILADLATKLGIRAKSVFVTSLPTIGESDTFYVIKNDTGNPNLANIYIWNAVTKHYIWVGDNTLYLGDYYTQEEGEQFEEDVNEEIESINNRVSNVEDQISSVAQGSPKGVYETVSALTSANPNHDYIYLVLADNKWYYYDNSSSSWTAGGTYLSGSPDTNIDPSSNNSLKNSTISWALTALNSSHSRNVAKIKYVNGWWYISNGNLDTYVSTLYGTQKFPVAEGDKVALKVAGEKYYLWYADDGSYISGWRADTNFATAPTGAAYCAADYLVAGGTLIDVVIIKRPLSLARKNEQLFACKFGGAISTNTVPWYWYASDGQPSSSFSYLSASEKFIVKGAATVRNTNAVSSERYYVFWDESGTFISTVRQDNYNNAVSVPSNAYWCGMDYQTSLNRDTLNFEITVSSEIVEEKDGDVVCARNGNNIQIKSKLYGQNKYIGVTIGLNTSQNGSMNISDYRVADSKPSSSEFITGSRYKESGDDICPIHYSGTYIGGNHGKEPVFLITSSNHGKTTSDIGSVWTSANGKDYIIYKIDSENQLSLMGDVNGEYSEIVTTTPTSPLTHKSGATSTSDISFSSVSSTQLRPAINKKKLKVVNDENEEITGNGYIVGKYIKIIESYQIIDVKEIATYLKTNVGSNTNTSYYNDLIKGQVLVENIYKFTDGCGCSVCINITTLSETYMDFFGGVQSAAIGNYFYVPFTINDSIAEIPANEDINFATYRWRDVNFPPYKYYQFDDSGNGFVLGYCIDTEQALPSVRKDFCADRAGFYYHPSKKCYPFFYCVNAHPGIDGRTFSFYAFRNPVIKSNNITKTWYETDKAIYYEIEFFDSFNGLIDVPEQTLGKKVTVIKKTDSVTIPDNLLSTGQILFDVDTKGSITLKFE